jgi:hypothetical protein
LCFLPNLPKTHLLKIFQLSFGISLSSHSKNTRFFYCSTCSCLFPICQRSLVYSSDEKNQCIVS